MKMLIGGQWRDASDGATLDVLNPATGAVIDTVPCATQKDVEEAVTRSIQGQKEWAAMPLHKRAEILRRFCDLVDAHHEELARTMSQEMGKPIREARGEFAIIRQLFNGFIEVADTHLETAKPVSGFQAGKERDFECTIREPIGTVVCIVPFNGPTSLFSHKAAPALVAGNAVIAKAPSDDPLTLLKIGGLLLEAGVPGDAFQLLTGRGSQCGEWLCSDPRIAKVSFTGSTETGLRINELCARHLIRTTLELGGNAPHVVLEDADVDLAVAEAIQNRAAYSNGQICATSKRFLIHASIKDAFTEKLIAGLSRIHPGDPSLEDTAVGTLISENAARKVEAQVQKTVDQGARLIYGGVRNGAFFQPAVLDGVTSGMDVAHDMEIFGPVFPLMTFETDEEAIHLANDTRYGLGASVFTRDMRKAFHFMRQLQAGMVVINGNSFYRSILTPFGGTKMSGLGREGLSVTLDEVTQVKTMVFKNIF